MHRRWTLAAIVVLAAASAASPARAQDKFFFQPKDRIVFLGDSITEQYDYTNFIEYYLVTRFPSWDLVIFNAGIGGDTANGGNGRAARDVLSEKPTAVTINFGMNDGGYKAPDDNIYKNYMKNQEALVKKLIDAKVRVALMATSPVEGRKRKDGETYNGTLGKFCDGLKDLAGKYGATHVDQFHPALAVLKKMTDDKTSFDCFPDSVHTNGRGGLLMAHSILTAMNAPAVVSDLTIDAVQTTSTTERCKVEGVKKGIDGTLAFTRIDEALPLVLTKDQQQLLPYLGQLASLNRYGLKVTGLDKDSSYEVKIDGKAVAKYTGADLAKGVNLALADLGPIAQQSQEVWKALVAKNGVLRWRYNNLRKAGPPPGLSAEEQKEWAGARERELEVLDKTLERHRRAVYEAAQPKGHEFSITRSN
jgi:lysophospholipase L1-like esterase